MGYLAHFHFKVFKVSKLLKDQIEISRFSLMCVSHLYVSEWDELPEVLLKASV